MLPEVIQVIPTDDYKVYVYMDDNTVRLYDAAPLIAKGGIFSRIQDIEIFKSTCTILNDTLAWKPVRVHGWHQLHRYLPGHAPRLPGGPGHRTGRGPFICIKYAMSVIEV